jgi:hypothetical protein
LRRESRSGEKGRALMVITAGNGSEMDKKRDLGIVWTTSSTHSTPHASDYLDLEPVLKLLLSHPRLSRRSTHLDLPQD